ncbi:MAG: DUF4339 domain-containing protein [Verrucomicrobiaceae bacterium]|nr:MAG: DUF4339 domain-containing protein [Verrucomicrobiaceae bacterium]
MASPLLFHVFRDGGAVTGPHPSAALRRELESGSVSLDTQVCLAGTEDWLPLSDWADEIQPQAPPQQLSARTAAYVQAVNTPPKNTAVRIFWGVILLLTGMGQGSVTFSLFGMGQPILAAGSLLLTIFWFVFGTSLMSAPKRRA